LSNRSKNVSECGMRRLNGAKSAAAQVLPSHYEHTSRKHCLTLTSPFEWQTLLLFLLMFSQGLSASDLGPVNKKWKMNLTETPAVLTTPFACVAYYVPREPRRVLVLASGYPWDDGTASTEQLRTYTLHDVERWRAFADRNHVLIVAPCFGSNHFAGYRELRGNPITPDTFLNMLIDGPVSERVPVAGGRFSLHGHSAGAQFSARYLVAHPERLEAVVLSAPSTYPFPKMDVPWPYGEGVEANNFGAWGAPVTGALSESNRPSPKGWVRAATSVPLTVIVGSQDRETRPPAPGNFGVSRLDRGIAWVREMQGLAKQNHCASTVRFRLAKGISHDETAMMIPAQSVLEELWRPGELKDRCSEPID